MKTLKIENIGPISSASLSLKKVNVLMGKQSSGKSTIAKIISYCTWVEKDIASSLSLEKYLKKEVFEEGLINFHKMDGFLNDNSSILYESDFIKINYSKSNLRIEWKNKYAFIRNKIAYIPAERNVVIMPEMEKVELPNNNIRSFLFDWFTARKNYTSENSLNILNLGVDFYYKDNGSTKENHIINKNYDLILSNASSGLQSVIPLIIMIDSLTNDNIFNEEESFDKSEKGTKLQLKLLEELLIKPYSGKKSLTLEENREVLIEISKKIVENKNKDKYKDKNNINKLLIKWSDALTNNINSNFTNLIIEEPEQNLYPSTQRDLIYFAIKSILKRNDDTLTLTTHSPYILYALNNCMMGNLIKDKIPAEQLERVNCKNSFINPKDVAIWQIEDNITTCIQEKDGLISNNFFDYEMKELMDDFYIMLNYYTNEN